LGYPATSDERTISKAVLEPGRGGEGEREKGKEREFRERERG